MMKKVLLKRKHEESTGAKVISSPNPPKKKKVVQWAATSNNVSDDETSVPTQAAARALLELSQAAMTNWAQYFDESSSGSSSDEDEDPSVLSENKMVQALVKATFDAAAKSKSTTIDASPIVKPDHHLEALVSKQTNTTVQYHKASDMKSFFEPVTESKTNAYSLELVKAVRCDDVATVRRLHSEGHSMEACNKFGDSIVHLACRRNSEQVLSFLLQECKVSAKLVCDYGRTPLHDACWTTSPNYTVISMLLDASPDLLYVKDARGSTPLEYLKKEFWQGMCNFLERRPVAGLVPKEL